MMTEWNKVRIDAAQKACDAATDGPWEWDRSSDDPFLLLAHAEIISEGDGEPGADDDLIFIEIARTEFPAVLKEIVRLQKCVSLGEDAYRILQTAADNRFDALEAAEAQVEAMRAVVEAAVEIRKEFPDDVFPKTLADASRQSGKTKRFDQVLTALPKPVGG